jgi:hypothetical protein
MRIKEHNYGCRVGGIALLARRNTRSHSYRQSFERNQR